MPTLPSELARYVATAAARLYVLACETFRSGDSDEAARRLASAV